MYRFKDKKKNKRFNDLRKALESGKKILQGPSVWPDCSPFYPNYNTPEFIADHLINREYELGLKTKIISQ